MSRWKRTFRWRLSTLLLMVSFLAVGLGVWEHWVAPYNRQLVAKAQLEPFLDGYVAVSTSPAWLSSFDRDRFHEVVEVRSRQVALSDEAVDLIPDLQFLRRLYLERTSLGDDGLHRVAQLPHVQRLSLWRTLVTDRGLPTLQKCRFLEALDLHGTAVSDRGMESLVTFPRLGELLVGKGVQGPGLRSVAEMPHLWRLDLSRSGVKYQDFHFLAGSRVRVLTYADQIPAGLASTLAKLPALQEFQSQLVRADDQTAKTISACKRLQSVNLAGVGLTDAATAQLVTMPSLGSLTLHGDLSDLSLQHVAGNRRLWQIHLVGRFSIGAIRKLQRIRPDLAGEITTVTAAPGETEMIGKLRVRPLLRPQVRRRSNTGVTVDWPATIEDVARLPAEQRDEFTELQLIDPPSLPGAFPSDFQVEHSLRGIDSLPRLAHLQLPRVAASDLPRLGRCRSLESLVLVDDRLSDSELLAIDLPASCKRFIMTPSHVTRDAVSQLRRRYPEVEIRCNGHGKIYEGIRWQAPWSGQGSIRDIVSFPAVERVQLEGISRTIDLTPLTQLPKLRDISLRGTVDRAMIWKLSGELTGVESFTSMMRAFDDDHLIALRQMPNLRRVLIRSSAVTDEAWKLLGDHRRLQDLDIQSDGLTGQGIHHLSRCADLQELRVVSPAFSPAHLESLSTLGSLRSVRLQTRHIDREAAEALVKLPSLESLDLSYSVVTDEAVAALGDCPKLRTLLMRSRHLKIESLWKLAECPTLRRVSCRAKSHFSGEELKRLRMQFPRIDFQ